MNTISIDEQILSYLYETNAVAAANRPLPKDQSLYDLGILDSLGLLELVEFIEKTWHITIEDDEINRNNLGGINKMGAFITKKLELNQQ